MEGARGVVRDSTASDAAAAPLTTPQVGLRRLTPADAAALQRVTGDPLAMRYWHPGPDPDVEAAAARISAIEAQWQRHGFGDWGVLDRSHGELIGFAGLHHLDGMAEVNLGYVLAPSHWRRGIGTELCRLLLTHAFTRLALPEVVAVIDLRNAASLALAERCGLSLRGPLRWQGQERLLFGLRQAEWQQGGAVDSI
jgi:ribosomal-protein-alanine N-acetyltransferase